jgi:hypothetical protein
MSKLPTGKIAAHNLLRNYSMMLGLYRPSGGPASQFQCRLRGIGIFPTCRLSLFLSLALVTAMLIGCTKGEDAPAAHLFPRYSIRLVTSPCGCWASPQTRAGTPWMVFNGSVSGATVSRRE